MAKVTPITEQFQHFLPEMKESFWGDLYGQTQQAWKRLFEAESERLRDRYSGWAVVSARTRARARLPQRLLRARFRDPLRDPAAAHCPHPRARTFCRRGWRSFSGGPPELTLLIREAFLRGISTRQVGRVVATLTGEVVSAQTVSHLTRDLDQAVRQFHQAPLEDDWAYLFLDGVSLRVRRPSGRQRVQMLVAYGVRRDGTRQLLAFLRTRGESQADWEALLQDLYRRGLEGQHLLLIVTDGCPGLAAAIQTVYPRAAASALLGAQDAQHPGEGTEVATHDAVKADAQAIYRADGRSASPSRGTRFLPPLAGGRTPHGATTGARSAGVAVVFPLPAASVEEAAHHQHHRTLFRGGASSDPAHGLLCQRAERGPHHLLHLPALQPGMENPHPPRFYTSSLTSPAGHRFLTIAVLAVYS